jgi:glucose 1-dehydrogenase
MSFQGKTVVVTGAAQGIGAACAKAFAMQGAYVVLADLDRQRGEAVCQEIQALGSKALYVNCDIGQRQALASLVDAAVAEFGDIDCCVCAAGVAPHTDFLDVSEEEFTTTLQVNLVGPFLLGQIVAARWVAENRSGAIVNISSTSALQSGPQQAAYCSSKAGLGGLTRTMAVALAPYKIRVNAVAPGPTRTGMMATVMEKNPDALKPIYARTPLGIAEPEEIAAAVLFVASEQASFMTGETLNVDGGRLVLNYTVPDKA